MLAQSFVINFMKILHNQIIFYGTFIIYPYLIQTHNYHLVGLKKKSFLFFLPLFFTGPQTHTHTLNYNHAPFVLLFYFVINILVLWCWPPSFTAMTNFICRTWKFSRNNFLNLRIQNIGVCASRVYSISVL